MEISLGYNDAVIIHLHHAPKDLRAEEIPGTGGVRDKTIWVGNIEIIVFVDEEGI